MFTLLKIYSETLSLSLFSACVSTAAHAKGREGRERKLQLADELRITKAKKTRALSLSPFLDTCAFLLLFACGKKEEEK